MEFDSENEQPLLDYNQSPNGEPDLELGLGSPNEKPNLKLVQGEIAFSRVKETNQHIYRFLFVHDLAKLRGVNKEVKEEIDCMTLNANILNPNKNYRLLSFFPAVNNLVKQRIAHNIQKKRIKKLKEKQLKNGAFAFIFFILGAPAFIGDALLLRHERIQTSDMILLSVFQIFVLAFAINSLCWLKHSLKLCCLTCQEKNLSLSDLSEGGDLIKTYVETTRYRMG